MLTAAAVSGAGAVALLVFSGGSEAEPTATIAQAVAPAAAVDGAAVPDRNGRGKRSVAPAPERAGRGAVIRVRNAPYGKVLHEKRSGLAAYLFTKEKRGRGPRCFGACANAWPPIKTKGRPIAGKGVDQDKLGTVARGSGRMVTYAGRPLYFYVGDSPGQILCNDVFEFGGDWFVVGPDGGPAGR